MSDINLLTKQKQSSMGQRVLAILRKVSVGSLIFVFTCAVFLFFLKLQSPLEGLQKQEKSLLAILSQSSGSITAVFVVHDRVKNIKDILSTRLNHSSSLDDILADLPAGIGVETFTITRDAIQITGAASSLETVNKFVDNLVGRSISRKAYQKVTLDNLVLDERNQRYNFSIAVQRI